MTIKEFRLSKGLKQAELAEALGISTSSERSYEYGVRAPSEAVVAKIKEVYGVDLNAPDKPAKKTRAKKAEPKETAKAKPAPKKAAPKAKPAAKKAARVVIQSAMGGEITLEEILAKVGDVDAVYIKPEENHAYWVKGEESGAVNLW